MVCDWTGGCIGIAHGVNPPVSLAESPAYLDVVMLAKYPSKTNRRTLRAEDANSVAINQGGGRKNKQVEGMTEDKKRVEQAEARTEQAETRIEQAKTRTEQAETRTELAETRTEQAETRTEQAKTRTDQAEVRTEQAETRTEQTETALENLVYQPGVLRRETSPRVANGFPAIEIVDQVNPVAKLTSRQREILQHIAAGQNTKQIAEILKISPKTVEYHRMKLMAGLNLHDVPGLVRYALRVGLISTGD